MFRRLLGHLQVLWEKRSKSYLYVNALWDPTMHWNIDSSWICFSRGPEDDLINVETFRPDNIQFLLYIEYSVVLLTDPLGRPRRRWLDIIRMDLQEMGCGYMDWIGLAQDRDRWRTLVSAVMNLRVPWNARNFLTSCKPFSFSRRTLYLGASK